MKYKLGAFLAIKIVDLILSTCKVRIYGLDSFIGTLKSQPTLFALWHNRLALTPFALSPYICNSEKVFAAVSKSSDGNWVQAIIDHYPHAHSIRIAHNKRPKAFQALIESVKNSRSMLIITPDGPRGPCYEAKPGILVTAKETGSPILPFTWHGSYWEIDSWDKFRIPKPFSKIDIYFGKPLQLAPETTLEEDQKLLEKMLNNPILPK